MYAEENFKIIKNSKYSKNKKDKKKFEKKINYLHF